MKSIPTALFLALVAFPVFASAPYQVVDLRAYPICCEAVAFPLYVGTFGTRAFLLTGDVTGPLTLRSTDGTEAGSTRLIDSFARSAARVENFVTGSDGIYFVHERKLWRSDGTFAGTVPVDQAGAADRVLTAHRGAVWFLGSDSRDVYRADASGVHRIGEIRTGTPQWTHTAVLGDVLYIATERGLWRSDGASLVRTFVMPAFSPIVVEGRLFFIGRTIEEGAELWTGDGTQAGSQFVRNIRRGVESAFEPETASMAAIGNRVLFVTHAGELGVSDGTSAGTYLLARGWPAQRVTFTRFKDKLLFSYASTALGRQLWVSDGTDDGTRRMRDVTDIARSARWTVSVEIAAGADYAYYYDVTRDGQGRELFRTDGETTAPVDEPPLPASSRYTIGNLTAIGDKVFYSAGNEQHGVEPWVSDEAGSRMIANFTRDKPGSSNPGKLFAGEDRLFFAGMGDEGERWIWITDGTAAGTSELVKPAQGQLLPTPLAAAGRSLYVTGWPNAYGALMKVDAGVPPLNLGGTGFWMDASVVDGRLFFRADSVWVTDGTKDGTREIYTWSTTPVVSFAGEAWFIDRFDDLYATDGTLSGTRSVVAVDGVYFLTAPQPFGGALIAFGVPRASSPTEEIRVFRFSGTYGDATVIGTVPASATVDVSVASIGTVLLFSARPARGGLWQTDGTLDGTKLVRELPGAVAAMASVGERTLIAVEDSVLGMELWASDGTSANTIPIRNISRAGDPCWSRSFVVADGIAYFAAADSDHGCELWRSDGTVEGTHIVADIDPGESSSVPAEITRVGNTLYFAATTTNTGRELWAYPLPDAAAIVVDDVHTREGAPAIEFPVRLTRASAQPVTVDYSTLDGTAISGRDYKRTSGTLTFAPGETRKIVRVPLFSDDMPATNRSLLLRVQNATTRIEKASGGAVIEEDDHRADLSIAIERIAYWSSPTWVIRNAGPSFSTNIRLCIVEGTDCGGPGDVLMPNQSFTWSPSLVYGYAAARVRGRETDPNSANDAISVLVKEPLIVQSPILRIGERGVLHVSFAPSSDERVAELRSSDSSVASIIPRIGVLPNAWTFSQPFTAHKKGLATLSVEWNGKIHSIPIRVIDASERVRIEPRLSFWPSWGYGIKTINIDVGHSTASGTTRVHVDGTVIADLPVKNGIATLPVSDFAPGNYVFAFEYSGDPVFFEGSASFNVTVYKGGSVISARRVLDSPEVVIAARADLRAPTGSVTVAGVRHSLKNEDARSSSVAVPAAVGARTITIEYSGDEYYRPATVTVPIEEPFRRRSIRP